MIDQVRVDFDELLLTEEQQLSWHGQPFTGTAYELFPSGKVRSEVAYVEGIRQGSCRSWLNTGRLIEEANNWQGVSHGLTRTWDDQGRLCREQRFEFGIKVSEKTFDEQGNVKNEWRISPSDNLYRTLELSRTKWGGFAPPVPL